MPDTEISIDGGASFVDCTNEITTGGGNGMGYITLTSTEMNNVIVTIASKSSNCVTSFATLHSHSLPQVSTGTLASGSAAGGILGTILPYDITNCWIQLTGGTGAAAGARQVRRILDYSTTTGGFTVNAWEVTPNSTTTYAILLPTGVTLGMLETWGSIGPGSDDISAILETTEIVVDGDSITAIADAISPLHGPVEHTPVPASRILAVKSRGDGTFGVVGRVRMNAGETLWWAVDLKGTQLSAGDLIDAVLAPTITGAQAANLTTPSYGVLATLVKFKCVLSGAALTTDSINIKLTVTPDGSESLIIIVPVTVLS